MAPHESAIPSPGGVPDDTPTSGASGKLAQEWTLVAELEVPMTGDLLIGGTFGAESSEKTDDAPPEVERPRDLGTGSFITAGDVLGGPAEVDDQVNDLRRALEGVASKEQRDLDLDLVALWIRVEPWLDDHELAEFSPMFLAALPGGGTPVARSRGAQPQGGGHASEGRD